MAVTRAPGVKRRVAGQTGSLLLQVRAPSDHELAAAVLNEAADHVPGIWAKDPAVSTADGPYLWYDHGEGVTALDKGDFIDHLGHSLVQAGLADGEIDVLDRATPLYSMAHIFKAVVLHLYPPPPPAYPDPSWPRPTGQRWYSELPGEWLDEAAAWIRGELADEDELWATAYHSRLTLPGTKAQRFLERCRMKRTTFGLVTGKQQAMLDYPTSRPAEKARDYDERAAADVAAIGGRVRAIKGMTRDFEPSLTLAGGGPDCTDDELLAIFATFTDLARRLAPSLAYGFVNIASRFQVVSFDFREMWDPLHLICDDYVFDAFPFQILSPGHLERLGEVPPSAQPLNGGRVELSLGTPEEWLDDFNEQEAADERGPRERVAKVVGRRWLAPCLSTRREAESSVAARRQPLEPDELMLQEPEHTVFSSPTSDEYQHVIHVSVPQANAIRTVRVDFGDGTSENASVPAGDGVSSIPFSHVFRFGVENRTYVHIVTIIETGAATTKSLMLEGRKLAPPDETSGASPCD